MFNYGNLKLLLLKLFLGIFLIGLSLFLFVSIYTFNPNDPGIGKLVGKSEITNFFGFWGAFFSSIFLILFGKASYFLVIFLSYLGVFIFLIGSAYLFRKQKNDKFSKKNFETSETATVLVYLKEFFELIKFFLSTKVTL